MRKVLEDFYYGNIIPCEKRMAANSNLRRAASDATRCESQLAKVLSEKDWTLLTDLVQAQQEIDSITAAENFIQGFRLGVRMMAECMDDNDGETKNGGE